MRTLGFEAPDELLVDEYSVVVDVYVEQPGGKDPDGNPMPPSRFYYGQDVLVDISPQSGLQRVERSGTAYESTHVMIARRFAYPIPEGALIEVKRVAFIGLGEVKDLIGKTFTVVFYADYGTHCQLDLKMV